MSDAPCDCWTPEFGVECYCGKPEDAASVQAWADDQLAAAQQARIAELEAENERLRGVVQSVYDMLDNDDPRFASDRAMETLGAALQEQTNGNG